MHVSFDINILFTLECLEEKCEHPHGLNWIQCDSSYGW